MEWMAVAEPGRVARSRPPAGEPHSFRPGAPSPYVPTLSRLDARMSQMPMTYPEWGARGSFLGCPVAHSGRTWPPSPSGPEEFFLYKETFPSAQLGRLSEHLGLRALGEGGAQGCGAGVLAVSKAILLILLRAGWGRAVLPHMAIGISQVTLLCKGTALV